MGVTMIPVGRRAVGVRFRPSHTMLTLVRSIWPPVGLPSWDRFSGSSNTNLLLHTVVYTRL